MPAIPSSSTGDRLSAIKALLNPADAACLFKPSGKLIHSRAERLEGQDEYPYPPKLLKSRDSIAGGFLPDDAAIPVVDGCDVIEAFAAKECLPLLPRFTLAGARQAYRLPFTGLKVGILAAGGPAPGMNTVIDSIVKRHSLFATCAENATRSEQRKKPENLQIVGYHGGYPGLLVSDTRRTMTLTPGVTDPSGLSGGCILHMPRDTAPKSKEGLRAKAAEWAAAVRHDKLDILYVIGGDGTLTAADALCEALQAGGGTIPRVVAAPKTMDNDISFTDVTFGFRTVVEPAVKFIQGIHTDIETCERIGVVELFGATVGWVALHAAYASGEADDVFIREMFAPEQKASTPEMKIAELNAWKQEVARIGELLAERYLRKQHALLVVAEGAARPAVEPAPGEQAPPADKDADFKALLDELKQEMNKHLGGRPLPPFTLSRPQHLIRSIPPNTADVDLCKITGKLMVDTALAGFTRCCVSLWHGRYCLVPLQTAVLSTKRVNSTGYYLQSMIEKRVLR